MQNRNRVNFVAVSLDAIPPRLKLWCIYFFLTSNYGANFIRKCWALSPSPRIPHYYYSNSFWKTFYSNRQAITSFSCRTKKLSWWGTFELFLDVQRKFRCHITKICCYTCFYYYVYKIFIHNFISHRRPTDQYWLELTLFSFLLLSAPRSLRKYSEITILRVFFRKFFFSDHYVTELFDK